MKESNSRTLGAHSRKLAFSVLVFALAAIITGLLWQAHLGYYPFLLFFVACSLAAWRGGLTHGLLVGLMSLTFVLTFADRDRVTWLPAFLFIGSVGIISALLGSLRRQRRYLQSKELELQSALEDQAQLSAIVASSADAIISEDLTGRILTWNEGAERIYGYTRAEAEGHGIGLLSPSHLIGEQKEMLETVRNGGRLSQFETLRRHKSGRLIEVSISVSPVKDPEGRIVGISKIARDISALKRVQERQNLLVDATTLLVSSLDYATTLDNVARILIPQLADWCGVYLVGGDGAVQRLTVAHRDPEKILWATQLNEKYPPDPHAPHGLYQVIRTGKSELYAHIPDELLEQTAHDAEHLKILREVGLTSAIFVPMRSHGKVFGALSLVSTTDNRIYTEEDVKVAEDIGRRAALAIENALLYRRAQAAVSSYENELQERRRIEVELRQAKQAADAASLAKSAFLANMSHEIRTPLGAIIGFSELLLLADREQQEEYVDIIKRNGQHLSTIIDDILDLTKVEAGHLSVESVEVDLAALFEELKRTLGLHAADKGIGFSFHLSPDLPQRILSDPLRLRQILNNIIGNAIKFTEQGSVAVKVRFLNEEPKDPLLEIEVHDTGAGLEAEHVGKLFEPFTQADPSTTRRYGGTGLGLSLSRRLARVLGGDVKILSSELGKGSCFVVTVKAPLCALPREAVPTAVTVDSEQGCLWPMKILLVDDSSDNQILMSRLLKLEGAEVDVAENGEEGVEKALKGSYDVVLMDVQMPVMDGFQALKALRDQAYPKPIIALTAHAMREEKERCLAHGFNNHLSKPVDRKLMREQLLAYRDML